MTVAITSLTVVLSGTVAPDVTALEIDGQPAALADDRTWSHAVAVPAVGGSDYVAVTAVAPDRVETRLVAIERVPVAPAGFG